MNNSEWLIKYKGLNNSFKKNLVFRIGVDSGFFAEYNNMVLAMLYCLKNEIKFVLSSQHAVFAYKDGWTDFFQPFCEENNEDFNSGYNLRTYKLTQDFKKISEVEPWIIKERVLRFTKTFLAKYHKSKRDITYLTQDLWNEHRNREFAKEIFAIPTLGFHNAGILEATQKVISEIWKYSPHTEDVVQSYKASLHLPSHYVAIHIRSGDKFIEARLHNIEEYISAAAAFAKDKNVFILTDDFSNIELLNKHYSDWNLFTLCTPGERGYFHEDFKLQNKEFKYNQHAKLFAGVDICVQADKFIGTYSSNPGMYIGMRCGEQHCHCLDYPNWILW